jgi:hypothetical protein
MEERYLYGTAVPILLDGGRLAGKTAQYLYAHYGLDVRWLGEGWHPLLAIYATRLASLPLAEENDGVITRHLLAFAKEWGRAAGIPVLIPCSPVAEAYIARAGESLEEEFVLLPLPDLTESPLRGLLRREEL